MRNKKWFSFEAVVRAKRGSAGFTLMEAVVATAIFAILISGILGVTQILNRSVKLAREKTVLASYAANEMEIVRNLPYSQVGTINGNPTGNLPDFTNAQTVTLENVPYKVYYEVTYTDDPADGTILLSTDVAPNDYKQVNMYVQNTITQVVTQFVTTAAPKGLEGLNNAGALLIKVFDSQGQPVSGASVHIENVALNPDIILDRTSDGTGQWAEVGLPASVSSYHIVVTKAGYSTDQTEPISVANPNPTKPDATIVNGTVTQVSFAIDLLSNLTIKTLNTVCAPLSGIGVNIRGAKIIGTAPTVYKYNSDFTSNGSGLISLSNIEWDTYTPTLLTGQSYIVYGTNPIQTITVPPGTNLTFTMILGAQDPTKSSLLVIVKDASSGLALEGASVHLQKGGSQPQDYYGTTGGSVWGQSDWSSGAGQVSFNPVPPNNAARYFQDDGNVDSNSAPTGMRLKKTSGDYAASGWVESSTFDTGSTSNYTTLVWEPTSQVAGTTLKFQVATNNDNTTWNYKGPDGTGSTYYTTSGGSLASVHDNDRYVRYKIFLSTTNDKKTPVLTSLALNYVAGCFTPGQSVFPDLTSGNNYDLDVSLAGYATYTVNSLDISGNQTLEVLMSP